MRLHFRWVRDDQPGPRWLELFERAWPSYSDWFGREGDDARPDLVTCRRQLREHMPELIGLWEALVDLSDGDERVARMLSLYRPTPFLSGCSQAVWTRGDPMLVRNYDYHPAASEGTFVLSAWTGTRVLAASDCLWGVLDGINEHGLAVALSFGGSRRVGLGFGIPLILRYVLETCRNVEQAAAVLTRVPSHMAYNVSLLDSDGDYAVALLAPGRKTKVRRRTVAVNHQEEPQWTEYARATRSLEREKFLEARLEDEALSAREFQALFLSYPLHKSDHRRGLATLYTAAYHPARGSVEFLWPTGSVLQSLEGYQERELVVELESKDDESLPHSSPGRRS